MSRWPVVLAAVVALAAQAAAQQPVPPPRAERGRLQAERVRYDARNGVFEARGNVRLQLDDATITCEVLIYHERERVAWAEGRVEVVQKGTTLRAPTVKYEANPQITYASGGVTVLQEDLELSSRDLKYRHRDEVAFAEGDVQLQTRNGQLSAPSLWADLKNKLAEAEGPSRLVRKGGPPPRGREGDRILAALAKEDTTITSQGPMKYAWLHSEEASAQGGVQLQQVDKNARAERIAYSESQDRVELSGSVRLEQRSGQWLVRERLVRPPRDEEERKSLETPAVLTADRVVITLSTRNAVATGNVRVVQEGRSAAGDRGEYDDAEGRIVLSGRRVRLEREDGSWLEAERVVVSLREDTFEAHGAVDTTFHVRR